VKTRMQTLLALSVAAVGLLVAVLLGLFAYMSATVKPLHPDPNRVPSAAALTGAPEWTASVERARQVIRAGLTEQSLPGLSVAIGIGGQIVWAEGFGWADLENQVPVTPETRFRIGTASIALTSAAAGLLVEQNRLNLDEQIQRYVPEFPAKQWPVTLRQLMAHVAGVRNDGGDEGPLLGRGCERTVEGLEAFAQRALLFEPGTQYRFSSYGWILVSAAVEAASGDSLLAFMRKMIFEPLAMRDTKPDSSAEPLPKRATPYFPRYAADPRYGLHLMRPVDYSCYAGASVFVSTPSDLVRFAMAVSGGKLLQPATVQLLQTPHRLSSGAETGYGLGWDVETVTIAGRETRWIGHDGTSLGGMVASLMIFPEHRIAVALTSNISYADTEGLGVKVAEAFAGQTGPPPGR
jgi:serine beta-lactamase-like protein LACTB, mitochondrial